jgi:hypothetical protein
LQVWQGMVHDPSQHSPPVQKPLAQSAPVTHAWPRPVRSTQAPPAQ